MGTLAILHKGVSDQGDLVRPIILASANGAVPVTPGALVLLTKAGVAAMTLAAPTAGLHDGQTMEFVSTTANAHTVTQTTPGFNNGSTASDVATFGAAIGNTLEVTAYNGVWYVNNTIGVTLA